MADASRQSETPPAPRTASNGTPADGESPKRAVLAPHAPTGSKAVTPSTQQERSPQVGGSSPYVSATTRERERKIMDTDPHIVHEAMLQLGLQETDLDPRTEDSFQQPSLHPDFVRQRWLFHERQRQRKVDCLLQKCDEIEQDPKKKSKAFKDYKVDVSSRMAAERQRFAVKVLRSVQDLRRAVKKRKDEIMKGQQEQEYHKQQLVKAAQEQEMATQLSRTKHYHRTEAQWRQLAEKEERAREAKLQREQEQEEKTRRIKAQCVDHTVRKAQQLQEQAERITALRAFREEQRLRNLEQNEIDKGIPERQHRRQCDELMKNVQHKMNLDLADAQMDRWEEHRRTVYEQGQQRQRERLQKIQDDFNRVEAKRQAWESSQARFLRRRHQLVVEQKQHREEVLRKAQQLEEDNSERVSLLNQLSEKKAAESLAHYHHVIEQRKDFLALTNEERRAKARRVNSAKQYRARVQLNAWTAKRNVMTVQEAEIEKMKLQTRQEKQRLQLRTMQLRDSHRHDDIKRLEEAAEQLDQEVRRGLPQMIKNE